MLTGNFSCWNRSIEISLCQVGGQVSFVDLTISAWFHQLWKRQLRPRNPACGAPGYPHG